jgi:hypothetical protein
VDCTLLGGSFTFQHFFSCVHILGSPGPVIRIITFSTVVVPFGIFGPLPYLVLLLSRLPLLRLFLEVHFVIALLPHTLVAAVIFGVAQWLVH